jgi:CRISPR/Cas system CMR-associated protein Cmr5 small subunit
MTKKLEELLDLPEVNDKKIKKSDIKKQESMQHDIHEFDKIANALPSVKGLGEMADKELNDIAERALQSYEDLTDLGMNVEARYSGRVFEVASTFLKTGLDAKVAKLDKKLKMVELQLKKEKMDKESSTDDGSMFTGEGHVVSDRNSLLEKLKNMDK